MNVLIPVVIRAKYYLQECVNTKNTHLAEINLSRLYGGDEKGTGSNRMENVLLTEK